MLSKAPDGSQIVSTRLPEEFLQRLDRYLDWSETSRRVKSARNAAIREALSTWLDHQEPLAGLVHPDTLQRQFRGAYDRLGPRRAWVPIYRLRQQLQWPHERFDAVLEALRAARLVEFDGAEPGAMSDRDVQDSYVVHGHRYRMLRWCG